MLGHPWLRVPTSFETSKTTKELVRGLTTKRTVEDSDERVRSRTETLKMLVGTVKTVIRGSLDFDLKYRSLKKEVGCTNLACRLSS